MTHKERQLNLVQELPIEKEFQIPDGLLIPSGAQILIKRIGQDPFISKGGIIVPEQSTKKKGLHGIVMAIGPDVDIESSLVKLGIKVEFREGLEEDTLHNGEAYLLIDQFHIKGIVPDGNFKHPKYPTNDELRREDRIEFTKRSQKKSKQQMDELEGRT